jgi:hypothetical protein
MNDLVAICQEIDDHLEGLSFLEVDKIIRAIYITNLCEMGKEERRECVDRLLDYINMIGDEIFEDEEDCYEFFLERRPWLVGE